MKNIPVFVERGETLPKAWEKSLIRLYKEGCLVKTQYDNPDDPPSRDSSMTVIVEEPLSEPRLHRDFPGGLEDLQEYVMEVRDGIKDHCVRNPDDATDTRWEYTYHQRLFAYMGADTSVNPFDQIENVCQQIAKTPYTRRAQAVTWNVNTDNACYDPPCMQSLWFRGMEDGDEITLNMNVRFRSRDAYKAAFMNMYALIELMRSVALRIQDISGRRVRCGRYCDFSDSYHIYGKDYDEFVNRFIKNLYEREFEDRTFCEEDVRPIMQEAIPGILEKAKNMGRCSE